MLRLHAPQSKTVAPPLRPGTCEQCRGIGNTEGAPCAVCDGFGRVKQGVRLYRDPATTVRYHAVSGPDSLIDTGTSLCPFVEKVRREWPDSADDIGVWRQDSELDPARLVAVLRPLPGGGLSVQWLN